MKTVDASPDDSEGNPYSNSFSRVFNKINTGLDKRHSSIDYTSNDNK